MTRPTLLLLVALTSALVACGSGTSQPLTRSPATASGAVPIRADSIEAAVASPHRAEENRARDGARHPVETLQFFGLEPTMRVVEVWPGRGWYTEILAPLLAERGKLIVALTDPEAEGYRGVLARDWLTWQQEETGLLGGVEVSHLSPPRYDRLAAPGSVDMVLTFRNTHNWVLDGEAEACFAAMYAALRPGGVLGLVQHRETPGAEAITDRRRGYLPEAYVIALAEGAGFVLQARSEINANPLDTRDHPEQVWSLPPSLRGGDTNRSHFESIGESDRMTLRFAKPETTESTDAHRDHQELPL